MFPPLWVSETIKSMYASCMHIYVCHRLTDMQIAIRHNSSKSYGSTQQIQYTFNEYACVLVEYRRQRLRHETGHGHLEAFRGVAWMTCPNLGITGHTVNDTNCLITLDGFWLDMFRLLCKHIGGIRQYPYLKLNVCPRIHHHQLYTPK